MPKTTLDARHTQLIWRWVDLLKRNFGQPVHDLKASFNAEWIVENLQKAHCRNPPTQQTEAIDVVHEDPEFVQIARYHPTCPDRQFPAFLYANAQRLIRHVQCVLSEDIPTSLTVPTKRLVRRLRAGVEENIEIGKQD